MMTWVISLILYIIMVIANWKIFTKAGEKGWKAIIPVYNAYILFKISWSKLMFWVYILLTVAIFILSPIIGALVNTNVIRSLILGIILFADSIALLVIAIIFYNKLSKAFGHGAGFTVGLVLLNFIFMLILAFGSSQYKSNSPKNVD